MKKNDPLKSYELKSGSIYLLVVNPRMLSSVDSLFKSAKYLFDEFKIKISIVFAEDVERAIAFIPNPKSEVKK